MLLGIIEVGKVASADNIADVLTKALPWSEFAPKAVRLLGIDAEDMEPQHYDLHNIKVLTKHHSRNQNMYHSMI